MWSIFLEIPRFVCKSIHMQKEEQNMVKTMGGNVSFSVFLFWLLLILNKQLKIVGYVCRAVKVNVGHN